MSIRASVSTNTDATLGYFVVDVAYIEIVASAKLDTSGRFKYVTDIAGVADSVSTAAAKNFTDVVSHPQDSSTLGVLKRFSDTPSVSDNLVATLIFIRTLDDTATISDSGAVLGYSTPKQEVVFSADTHSKDSTKVFADGFAMNDGSETVDGSVYSVAKGVSNVAFVGDSNTLIFATSSVESISATAAGILSMQDYCELTYFAQDYVGVSRVL